jgi:cytochrome d ubiquinol oxidase subunit II
VDLSVVWFVLIAVLWTGFVVLEGFDLGVGMLHRALGGDETGRRTALSAIAPVWDGNEVWLIVGGAAIFAAFPAWYATWFSALYLALVLLLAALILRGLGLEWGVKVREAHWRTFWSWALVGSSALVPLLIGVALGDLLVGLPIGSDEEFAGTFTDLLQPYALWLGVTLLLLCLLHGAAFLRLRLVGDLHSRAERLTRALVWPAIVLVVAYSTWTANLSDGPAWARWALLVPVVAAAAAAFLAARGGDRGVFTATSVTIGGTVATLFANLYPNVMVSSTDAAYNLTVAGTSSAQYALTVMTVVAVVLLPVVLLYQGWTYYVFRARIKAPEPIDMA